MELVCVMTFEENCFTCNNLKKNLLKDIKTYYESRNVNILEYNKEFNSNIVKKLPFIANMPYAPSLLIMSKKIYNNADKLPLKFVLQSIKSFSAIVNPSSVIPIYYNILPAYNFDNISDFKVFLDSYPSTIEGVYSKMLIENYNL